MDTINNSLLHGITLSAGGLYTGYTSAGGLFTSGGAAGFNGNTTTTTGTFMFNTHTKEKRDTKIINDPEGMLIEVIYEMIPNQYVSYGFGLQDNRKKMCKEIYGVLDGKLQLIKEVQGYENPGYYVDPELEWEE